MNNLAARLLLSSLVLTGAGAAQAAISSFGTPQAGWNVGTGQPVDGFWLSTLAEAEVGLRSQDYQVGVSANNGAGDYFVTAGERSPGSGWANWNLDISADTFPVPLRNFDVRLTIDWDPKEGTQLVTYSIDALLANSTQDLFQQSQNLGFAFWGHAFNPYATGTYTATLSISNKGEARTLASSTINIHVNGVPEPASAALVALALVGAGAARTRKSFRGS